MIKMSITQVSFNVTHNRIIEAAAAVELASPQRGAYNEITMVGWHYASAEKLKAFIEELQKMEDQYGRPISSF